MRFFVAMLGVFILTVVVSFEAYSQNEEKKERERRVYGTSGSGTSAPNLFNSPTSSHGTGGPLSLKQIIQGREKAATGDRYATYGGNKVADPYGINSNNYALNISSSEVSAYREHRNFMAQQREEKALEELAEFDPAAGPAFFNPNQNTSNVDPKGKPKSIYIKRNKGFDKPKRIFRSVR